MLKSRYKVRSIAFAVLLGLGLVALAFANPSKQPEPPASEQHKNPNGFYEGPSIFIRSVQWVEDRDTFVEAGSTAVIALFTIILAVVGICEIRLTRDALKLSRDEFISTHRPRLRVRAVRAVNADKPLPIQIQYEIVNVGDSDARILRNEVTVEAKVSASGEDQLWAREIGGAQKIVSGEAILVSRKTDVIFNGVGELYARVWLQYLDDRGVCRRTQAYRTYKFGSFYLGGVEPRSPDYEYED